MSSGIRLAADASSLISPRRPAGHAGRLIAGLPDAGSLQRKAEAPKAFPPHANVGRSRNAWTG